MTEDLTSFHDFNQSIIDEFRANDGRVGGMFEGARLLLLTTTGARSGRKHTTPVGYLPDGAERMLIIASAGGGPHHPAWFHNLRANPRVTVEDGTFTHEADAVVLEGEERDAMFSRAAEADPGWAEYQAKTDRTIPVVALHPVGGAPNAKRPGDGLIAIHDAFRRELAVLRGELARSGPGLGAQLRVNCLTMCQGLTYHHTMEDTGMFPGLAETYPELSEVIDRLGKEHGRVHELLERIQERISDADAEPATVRSDVDTLITELEAHLTYEEEQLVPILNNITP